MITAQTIKDRNRERRLAEAVRRVHRAFHPPQFSDMAETLEDLEAFNKALGHESAWENYTGWRIETEGYTEPGEYAPCMEMDPAEHAQQVKLDYAERIEGPDSIDIEVHAWQEYNPADGTIMLDSLFNLAQVAWTLLVEEHAFIESQTRTQPERSDIFAAHLWLNHKRKN